MNDFLEVEKNNSNEERLLKVEDLLNCFSILYKIGFNNRINLPQVVVIGAQSTGKSSVIEALSGINLPRGNDIVTKVPAIVSMVYSPDLKEKQIYFEGGEDPIDNNKLGDLILEKQKEILNGKDVSDTPIRIMVKSNDVANLTLIDLPGLVAVGGEGQSEDISVRLEEMTKTFIKNERAIILCVCPATMDFVTNQAIKLAKEVDPEKKRTIGVLTKCDLVQDIDNVKMMLNQEKYKMNLGIFAVRNRSIDEVKKKLSFSEARKKENSFFEARYPDHLHLCGGNTLAQTLSDLLKARIDKEMPNILKEMQSKLEVSKRELEGIGIFPQTETEKRMLIYTFINDISQEIVSCFSNPKILKIFSDFRIFGDEIRNLKIEEKEDLLKLIEEQRGEKLFGFLSFPLFQRLMLPFIKESVPLCNNLENGCFKNVKLVGESIIKEKLKTFPLLLNLFCKKFDSIIDELWSECKKMTKYELDKQQSLFFTNNHYYTENIKKNRKQRMEGMLEGIGDYEEAKIPSMENEEKSDMMDRMQSYFKVVQKRIMDEIPLTVYKSLIFPLKGNKFVSGAFLPILDFNLSKILREDPSIQSKRKKLQIDVEKYTKGVNEIEKLIYF